MAQVLSIHELRERIRALEGAPQVLSKRVASGVPCIDDLIGGLLRPGLLELSGSAGSGAIWLALQIAAAETQHRRRVAWIDGERSLYPPTARDQGVDLDRLLIVRAPAGGNRGGQAPGIWATEQVLRSGCFRLVVTTPGQHLPRFTGTRWRQSSEKGCCTCVVVTRRVDRNLQPDVRLQVGSGRLVVARDRHRGPGAIALLPR